MSGAGAGAGRGCDVAIAGGGLVGATLAAALAGALRQPRLSVALIDPKPRGAEGSDARSLAISHGSARFYRTLGMWDGEVEAAASPIAEVHVSRRGRFGATRLRAAECGVDALGYVVQARALERRLEAALAGCERSGRLRRVRAAVEAVERRGRDALVVAREPDGGAAAVAARLVVGADGADSAVRRAAGLPLRVHRCDHVAVAGDLVPERPHRGRAFERFTEWGPLALLPFGEEGCAFIWALPESEAGRFTVSEAVEDGSGTPAGAERSTGTEAEASLEREAGSRIGEGLARAFGSRLGELRRVEVRVRHRLRVCHAPRITAERTVLVGNAANALHPIGAQGFNLGLRDVEALAAVLGAAADGGGDPAEGLALYRASRRADHRMARLLTEGLLRVFGSRAPFVSCLGAAGLFALERNGPMKRRFVQAATGAGRSPRARDGGRRAPLLRCPDGPWAASRG